MHKLDGLILGALITLVVPSSGLENGLARTPPMGWLAWERYVCELDCHQYPGECIDFNLFKEMADRLVFDGYRQVGYEYVNIDDCWSLKQRDPTTGSLVADPSRFPSPNKSIGALGEHLHSLGLKLGIYGDCGTETCQGFPGQLKYNNNLSDNYYSLDARQFADWQVDSFKFDGCNMDVKQASRLCPSMGVELNKTSRPMLFSCSWPAYENDEHLATDWPLVVERCNLWRAFGDIEDSWRSVLDTIDWFVRKQELIVRYHGPGHWFDADQLVVGDFGLSEDQQRAQMAVWCIWASPLYMSNDLRSISKESSRILRNKWAIAVNQDRMGIFGLMVHEARSLQVFVKPIEPLDESPARCPSYALVYLDRRTLGNGRFVGLKLVELIGKMHDMLAKLGDQPEKYQRWSQECTTSNRSSLLFDVYDIFDNNRLIQSAANLASDSLRLRVDPSGVRMVTLFNPFEVASAEPAGRSAALK